MRLTVNYGAPKIGVSVRGDELNASTGTPVIREVEIESGSLPMGGNVGDVLIKRSLTDFDAEWVPPADHAEQDNTRPITAAAVYTEIGNINALLATI